MTQNLAINAELQLSRKREAAAMLAKVFGIGLGASTVYGVGSAMRRGIGKTPDVSWAEPEPLRVPSSEALRKQREAQLKSAIAKLPPRGPERIVALRTKLAEVRKQRAAAAEVKKANLGAEGVDYKVLKAPTTTLGSLYDKAVSHLPDMSAPTFSQNWFGPASLMTAAGLGAMAGTSGIKKLIKKRRTAALDAEKEKAFREYDQEIKQQYRDGLLAKNASFEKQATGAASSPPVADYFNTPANLLRSGAGFGAAALLAAAAKQFHNSYNSKVNRDKHKALKRLQEYRQHTTMENDPVVTVDMVDRI